MKDGRVGFGLNVNADQATALAMSPTELGQAAEFLRRRRLLSRESDGYYLLTDHGVQVCRSNEDVYEFLV